MNREAKWPEARFRPATPATPGAGPAPGELWRQMGAWWKRILRLSHRAPRRLRLAESLPLGERRFVAVIEFEQARFLLGGTSASLVLLARLPDPVCASTPPGNDPGEISGGRPQ